MEVDAAIQDERAVNLISTQNDTPVHFVQSTIAPAPGLLVLPPGRRVPFGAAPSSIGVCERHRQRDRKLPAWTDARRNDHRHHLARVRRAHLCAINQ